MGFFKKAMASIGIGSAKVDTELEARSFKVGDEIRGCIHVRGGNVEQHINKITVKLMTYYLRTEERTVENDGIESVEEVEIREDIVLNKVDFFESFTIGEKEAKDLNFSFMVPYETPITFDRESVWVQTELDIASAIDSGDRDYIQILPHPYVQYIFDILMDNFRLSMKECEHKFASSLGRGIEVIQEFEFKPNTHFKGQLEELEVIFFVSPEGLEMIMEVDMKARGLRGFILESLDLDESKLYVKIPAGRFEENDGSIANEIYDLIMQHV